MAHQSPVAKGGHTGAGRTADRSRFKTRRKRAVSGDAASRNRPLVFGAVARDKGKWTNKRPQRTAMASAGALVQRTPSTAPAVLLRRVRALRKQNRELKRALRALRSANHRLTIEIRSLRSNGASDSPPDDENMRGTAPSEWSINRCLSDELSASQSTAHPAPRRTDGRQRSPWSLPGDGAVRSARARNGGLPDEAADPPDNQQEVSADDPPRSVYDALFPESEATPDVVPDPAVWDVVYASVPTNYSIPDADFAAFLAASLDNDAVESHAS